MYIARRDYYDPKVQHYIRTGQIVGGVLGSVAGVALLCLAIFFIRRNTQRKKKRAALNEEAAQSSSDPSSAIPGLHDNDNDNNRSPPPPYATINQQPIRSIAPQQPIRGEEENEDKEDEMPRSVTEKPGLLQGAADTIVNVRAADLPGASSGMGHLRELEAITPSDDGPVELPEKPKPS